MASSRVRYAAPGSDGGGASNSAGSKGSGIGGATLEGPALERLPVLIAADPAHQVIEVGFPCGVFHGGIEEQRSEEHTSELQSLMRISYDVFCLKKKKEHINRNNIMLNL